MEKMKLIDAFKSVFGEVTEESLRVFYAPGRVNLIGEHIDYNGGFVFPCAIDRGTHLVVRPRSDKKLRAYSGNFESLGIMEADLEDTSFVSERDWFNYPLGVIHTLKGLGHSLNFGFDAYFFGTIPNGAGLSSSASIEVVTAVMVNTLGNFGIPNNELAVICQKSENEYNGVNCGIMDQFAIAMGKKDHAILLNCDTLAYEYVPFQLENHKIVIINSNKKRSLAESNYNERRESCEEALETFRQFKAFNYLVEITPEEFELWKDKLSSERIARRARHTITEQQRVIDAVKALKLGDINAFGKLMNASHLSLKEDYEVTGKELDALAELSWGFEGVAGGRMTGAGFGGCTVHLVEKDKVEAFVSFMESHYEEAVGLKAECYVVEVGQGAEEVK